MPLFRSIRFGFSIFSAKSSTLKSAFIYCAVSDVRSTVLMIVNDFTSGNVVSQHGSALISVLSSWELPL